VQPRLRKEKHKALKISDLQNLISGVFCIYVVKIYPVPEKREIVTAPASGPSCTLLSFFNHYLNNSLPKPVTYYIQRKHCSIFTQMKHLFKTIFLLYSLSAFASGLLFASEAQIDTAGRNPGNRNAYRDSLMERERTRALIFERTDTVFSKPDPFFISSSTIFSSDAKSPSELLGFHPFFSSVKYGVSSSLNRFLPYGNVAPINHYSLGGLFNRTSSLIRGTDLFSASELSTITVKNGGDLHYQKNIALSVPEAALLWENGVFDENILQVRFSRPFSEHLMASVYSNYRHFKDQKFSHEGNDVYHSFSRLFKDTTKISRIGYNPLTDEHIVGANLEWQRDSISQISLQFSYGDLSNEVALDTPKAVDNFEHALFKRYPLQLQIQSSWNLHGRFFLDADCIYETEPVTRTTAGNINGKLTPVHDRGKSDEAGLAFRSGFEMAESDSAGIMMEVTRNYNRLFDSSEIIIVKNQPALYYKRSISGKGIEGALRASAGVLLLHKDDLSLSSFWNAGIDLSVSKTRFRGYVQQDNITYTVQFDSISSDLPLIERYYKAGLEFYRAWNKFDLLLGYQFVYGISDTTVNGAWLNGVAPYTQPRSVLVIAPGLGEWKGFSLRTSAMISDKKPYVKARGSVSYTAHPLNTKEHIDATLSFDYWSERDPVMFAGHSDWNVPIYNLNLEISTHIRSFRLFYKIDNLLNQRFAYVPGYYSPGITFRWGINWFIQR
jgi:hypothetical protein